MTPEYVYPYDRLVEVGIRALGNVIINMLLVAQCIQSLEDEVKEGLQVLRTWTGHEYVGVAVCESSCYRQAQSG